MPAVESLPAQWSAHGALRNAARVAAALLLAALTRWKSLVPPDDCGAANTVGLVIGRAGGMAYNSSVPASDVFDVNGEALTRKYL